MRRRKNLRGCSEKTAIQQHEEASGGTSLLTPWSWGSASSRGGDTFLLLEPPSLWGFVIAALANKYTYLLPITWWLNHTMSQS